MSESPQTLAVYITCGPQAIGGTPVAEIRRRFEEMMKQQTPA
jgi:hypothetical protein